MPTEIGVIKDGKKICRGPLHPEGKWVTLDRYYTFKTGRYLGKPFHKCIPCTLLMAMPKNERTTRIVGMIDVTPEVQNIFRELEHRVGRREACRRMNASNNYLRMFFVTVKPKRIKLETVIKAKIALEEARANNEVRHRHSIHHGAYLRGREEKRPVHNQDLYCTIHDGRTQDDRRRKQKARQAA